MNTKKDKDRLKKQASFLKSKYENAIEKVKEMHITPQEVTPTYGIYVNVVYISHPYAGKKENIKETENIINTLDERGVHTISVISPLHNFSFAKYSPNTTNTYWEDLLKCIKLLNRNTNLILCGDWRNSLGCCVELLYCLEEDIMVYELKK